MGLLSLQKGVNCADFILTPQIDRSMFYLYCFSRYISQAPMNPFEYYLSLGNVWFSHASWDCLFMHFVYCKHHNDLNLIWLSIVCVLNKISMSVVWLFAHHLLGTLSLQSQVSVEQIEKVNNSIRSTRLPSPWLI